MPYSPAQVLEARFLLSSVLVDTTPLTTIQGTEGEPSTNVVLMTFTDDDAQAQAGDFSISSLDWGGTTVGTAPSAQVVADPNYSGQGSGWMVVVDTVTFGDVGTYPTSLTVHVADGSDVSSTNTSFAVADAALTDTTPTTGVGQALGTASANVTLMTFSDANPYAVASDFSVAQLDWGGALNGSSPTVEIVSDPSYTGAGSGWKVVADSVTYDDAGRHAVAISVHDQDGEDVSSSTFSIRSAALSDTSPGTTFGAVQGEASTNVVLMTFTSTDPQAQSIDFSISNLDWGGTLVGTTPSMTFVADPSYAGTGSGWTIVADTVTYADVGSHTVSLTVKDQDGISTSSAVTKFSVANAALQDTTPVMTTNASTGVASSTIVMVFTDANPYATASQYSVTNVTWGGTLSGTAPTTRIVTDVNYTGTGSGWTVIADSLAYADAGQYLVSVTIQDEAGDSITTSNVTVDVTLLVLSSQVTRLPSTTAATPIATDYVVNESTKLWEMTAASAALTASTVSIPVSWTGSANAVSYTVYVSEDGGTFSPFVTDTTATSATFTGAVIGHVYAFYSIAKDAEGNVEQSTGVADTSTNVDSLSAYAREAGLEGFYYVDRGWAEVLQDGSTVTLIDGTGQSSSGTIANATQITAGNLEGTYDRDEATITFADGTVWEQSRQVAGRWLTDGRAEVGIQQLGTDLTFTNAQGTTSTGQFTSADEIVATDWGLTGRLTSYGTRIRWSDGTVWDLIPELDGASANASGNPNRVEQFGETLVFVNRVGQTSAGLFIGQNLVMATDWGNIVGKLQDGAIYWTNGTTWTHQTLTGTDPDVGGLWDAGGSDVRILQTGSSLTFVNKNGESSTGHFLSSTEVVADDWGGAQGTLSGDTLTWTASGTVWTRLPDLGATWIDSTSQATGINQVGRSLTLTDAQGVVSHATLTSPTRLQESDGSQRTGTISGSTITFADGAVWSLANSLRGNWFIGTSSTPAYILQSHLNVLFVTGTGAIFKGSYTGLNQLSLTESGVSNPTTISVEVTNEDLLTFDDQTQWQRASAGSLDAAFADMNLWPFL